MTRIKIGGRNIRKLSRLGSNSLGITLPVEEVRKLGWREGRNLNVKRMRGGFLVRDLRN